MEEKRGRKKNRQNFFHLLVSLYLGWSVGLFQLRLRGEKQNMEKREKYKKNGQ